MSILTEEEGGMEGGGGAWCLRLGGERSDSSVYCLSFSCVPSRTFVLAACPSGGEDMRKKERERDYSLRKKERENTNEKSWIVRVKKKQREKKK